jgi:photosystem II stability/assembly factor-like uncharacterized protein
MMCRPASAASAVARAGAGRSLRWFQRALALALWAVTVPVAAHSFPTPFRVLFDAEDPAHMAVMLRPGIAFTDGGGESWRFLCGALTGIAGSESYPVALAGRHLLVGGFVGLYRDDGYGCAWSRVEDGLPGARILSFAQVDDDAVEALVAASKDQPAARYVSRDQGATWQKLTAALPSDEPRTQVRVSGEANRIFLIGRHPSGTDLAIWSSEDGGESWVERSRLAPGCDELLALEPGAAGRIFMHCRKGPAADGDPNDRVLVSYDGAASFTSLIMLPEIGGFALGADGDSAWVGSRAGGLWRVSSSGELSLLHATLHVGCLQYRDGALWVCARDESGYDDFALAVSHDGGHTLLPFLKSVDVTALQTCGNPAQGRICSDEWNQWQADVALARAAASPSATVPAPAAGAPLQVAGSSADPVVELAAPSRSSGCTLHAAHGSGGHGCFVVCVWLLLMAARRRR